MGISQSAPFKQSEEEEEEEEEEDDEYEEDEAAESNAEKKKAQEQVMFLDVNFDNAEQTKENVKDELEQDPEIVPFESSASPASSVNTPHLGPTVRVWDPGHVLNPLALLHHGRSSFSSRLHIPPGAMVGDEVCTEVYLIRHGETNTNTLPELISGRSPSAMLTTEGKRQARALGVFLLSHGLHFDAVFSSPVERCKQTAISVCQEVNFAQEKIEFNDAVAELSQGLWEGLRRSEIYTTELVNLVTSLQPDFHAPGGESQRQVEFRMVEFLNNVVLPKAFEANLHKDANSFLRKQGKANTLMQVHPLDDMEYEGKASDLHMPLLSHEHFLSKGAGKSRLCIASSSDGGPSVDSPSGSRPLEQKAPIRPSPFYVAVFSHAMAIKCLLRGILGSDPHMTHRLCIDNTSVTVLKHSTHHGWQVQRVNDTAHLRLL